MLSARQLACACALTGAALTATAAPGDAGFYIGIGVGQSRYNIDFANQVSQAYGSTVFTVTSATMDRTHDTASRIFGGYQFSPHIAVEGGWQDFGSATGNYALRNTSNGDTFQRQAEWGLSGFNATLVGMIPFAERFTINGKVGAFFSRLEYSESTMAVAGLRTTVTSFNAPNNNQVLFTWGAGGSYRFADQWSVRLDWDRIENVGDTFALTDTGNGKFDHVDVWSVNLVWKF